MLTGPFALLRRLVFFSRSRRHTSWPRDWSSDVCSSDLTDQRRQHQLWGWGALLVLAALVGATATAAGEIGRASCREREKREDGHRGVREESSSISMSGSSSAADDAPTSEGHDDSREPSR